MVIYLYCIKEQNLYKMCHFFFEIRLDIFWNWMNWTRTLSVKLACVIRVNKSKNPKTSRVETKLVFFFYIYIFNNTNNNNNKFILKKNIKSLSMKLLSPHKKFNYRIAKNEKIEKEREKREEKQISHYTNSRVVLI